MTGEEGYSQNLKATEAINIPTRASTSPFCHSQSSLLTNPLTCNHSPYNTMRVFIRLESLSSRSKSAESILFILFSVCVLKTLGIMRSDRALVFVGEL